MNYYNVIRNPLIKGGFLYFLKLAFSKVNKKIPHFVALDAFMHKGEKILKKVKKRC